MSLRWAFDAYAKWQCPTSQEWNRAMASLSDEAERIRIRKFHYQSDARSALIGRLLLEKFAHEHLVNASFQRSFRGRPELRVTSLEHSKKWDFNVSHQGNYVVFAAEKRDSRPRSSNIDDLSFLESCDPASFFETRNALVGVDVMRYCIGDSLPHEKDQSRFFHLMRRQFSDTEWTTIKAPSSGDELGRSQLFYRHWCLKESFVKALGVGLTVSLKDLSFKLRSDLQENKFTLNSSLFVKEKPLQQWTFQETLLDTEHIACVALSNPGLNETVPAFHFFQSIEDILPPLRGVDGEYFDKSEWEHYSRSQEAFKPF